MNLKLVPLCIAICTATFILKADLAQAEAEGPEGSLFSAAAKLTLEGLANGVLGDSAGRFDGWVLGALGLSSGDDSSTKKEAQALNDIKKSLEQISKQLETIDQDINKDFGKLQKLIAKQICAEAKQKIASSISKIDERYKDYTGFIADATGRNGKTTPTVPPVDCTADETTTSDCLVNWANEVIKSLPDALEMIHQTMISAPHAPGMIQLCLSADLLPPPGKDTFDDTTYYEEVYGLINYFYVYQVKGLNLLVEAYHFHAWLAAGRPGGNPGMDKTVVTNLCGSAKGGNECNQANVHLNSIYENIIAQFKEAGAPYSSTELILHYDTAPTDPHPRATLYPRSLEDFTVAAGDRSCTTPLGNGGHDDIFTNHIVNRLDDPHAVCGPLSYWYNPTLNVNRIPDLKKIAQVSYGGCTGWTTADADSYMALVTGLNDNTWIGNYMHEHGFNYTDTSYESSENFKNLYSWCLDENGCPTKQACLSANVNLAVEFINTGGSFQPVTARNDPGDYQDGVLHLGYVWPALKVQDAPCTSRSQGRYNYGGAFTRCGSDLDFFLEFLVPKPAHYVPNLEGTNPTHDA